MAEPEHEARIGTELRRHVDLGAACVDVNEHRTPREQRLERAPLVGGAGIIFVTQRIDRGDLERLLADELYELFGRHQAGIDRIAQDALGAVTGGGSDPLDRPLAACGVAQDGAVGGEGAMRAAAPACERALDIDQRCRHAVLDQRGHDRLQTRQGLGVSLEHARRTYSDAGSW